MKRERCSLTPGCQLQRSHSGPCVVGGADPIREEQSKRAAILMAMAILLFFLLALWAILS